MFSAWLSWDPALRDAFVALVTRPSSVWCIRAQATSLREPLLLQISEPGDRLPICLPILGHFSSWPCPSVWLASQKPGQGGGVDTQHLGPCQAHLVRPALHAMHLHAVAICMVGVFTCCLRSGVAPVPMWALCSLPLSLSWLPWCGRTCGHLLPWVWISLLGSSLPRVLCHLTVLSCGKSLT